MAGGNVTPCLSRTHTAVLHDGGKQTYDIHPKKKPEANAKQREVWEEISGSSPKKPIQLNKD